MDRIYPLIVTVPAGTPIAAPLITSFPLEDNLLVDVEVLIPSGHAGFTGVRVQRGDVVLVPWGQGTWLVGSDYNRVFPVGMYITANAITIVAYNTDIFVHSFHMRAHISEMPEPSSVLPPAQQADTSLPSISAIPVPLTPDAILGAGIVAALATMKPSTDIAPLITVPEGV